MRGIFSTIPSELHQAGLHGHGSVVPVRQTVLTGRVDANGQANFLEAQGISPILNKIVGNKNNSTSGAVNEWITLRAPSATSILAARLVITKNGGGATVNVAEFEFYNGATQITGITGSATSEHPQGTYGASKAFDGVASSSSDSGLWHSSAAPSDATPQNLMGKLASVQAVTHVRILASAYDTTRQPENFEVQFTTDATAVVGDPANSSKWFAVNLTNGKDDGTEQAMNAETDGTAITPSAGSFVGGSGFAIDLKASQVPVEVAFAAGFHDGALDYVERLDADLSAAWTLPANATNFLYIDRDPNTGLISYGFTSLAPTYSGKQPTADNVAIGGTQVANGSYSGWPLANAFDDSTATGWGSPLLGAANYNTSYIGYVWPEGIERALGEIHLHQGAAGNMATTVKIQRTLDGVNWLDVTTANIVAGSNVIPGPAGVKARGWRLMPTAGNINADAIWIVYDLKLMAPAFSLGSHWFDLPKMVMRVGNDDAWVERQRVFVGEAVTDGSGVVSVITYALQGRYDSGWFPVAASTNYTKSHNIGSIMPAVIGFSARKADGSAPVEIGPMFAGGASTYGGQVRALDSRTSVSVSAQAQPYFDLGVISATSGQFRLLLERGWGAGGGGSAVAEAPSTVEMGSTEVPVRQTVLDGRTDANGYANFLEAGAGLTVDLKATAKPVVMAFADGFGERGAVDYVKRITADIPAAWSLPANATSYLYVDLDRSGNASFGLSSLVPIYSAKAPEFVGSSIIQAMTSDTSPAPQVASASSTYSGTFPAWKAFDKKNTYDTESWVSASSIRYGSVQIDLGAGNEKVAGSYVITSRNQPADPYTDPITWTFEGSNDNSNWVILDSKSNQPSWTSNETRSFPLSNTSAFRYYRLNISEIEAGGNYATIGELDIIEAGVVPENQHWFDLSTMTMKVWSGSAWVDKHHLFVGEATTDTNGITALVTYAIRGQYTSGRFSIAGGTLYTKNHNIGCEPRLAQGYAATAIGGELTPIQFWPSGYGMNIAKLGRRTVSLQTHANAMVVVGNNTGVTAVEAQLVAERGW